MAESSSHEVGPSTSRCALSLGATSALMAAAWFFSHSVAMWASNAVAGLVGILSAWFALGPSLRRQLVGSRRAIALGAVIGVALIAATQISAWLVLPEWPALLHETTRLYARLRGAPGPVWASPIIVVAGIAEEFVFRGVVTSWCERHSSVRVTWAASTVIYATTLAASGSLLLVAIGITLGGVWTGLRLHSGSLWPSLVSHLVWSIATFTVAPIG